MAIIDSRCGIHCTGCEYKASHNCGGCIETNGNPFHGECPVAVCCQSKGFTHCGECPEIPCQQLYAYSYTDPEHGDKPQGARVAVCRRWAAESGVHKWENVLLTDSGFVYSDGKPKTAIIERFAKMLAKPFNEAKVLFIPTAYVGRSDYDGYVTGCKNDLIHIGILPENITVHDIDGSLSESDAMAFDVIYFTGGSASSLLLRIRETGFDKIVRKLVYANKVYVGVSAGSMVAMPKLNIDEPFNPAVEGVPGLCLINAYFTVHCKPGTPPRTDLPLPHLAVTKNQAFAVSWSGYELVE